MTFMAEMLPIAPNSASGPESTPKGGSKPPIFALARHFNDTVYGREVIPWNLLSGETVPSAELSQAGASVIGVDHRMRIGEALDRFPSLAVQGNLDPVVLMADRDVVRTRTLELLDEVGGRPGHIFNLGHGILPATPVDNVIALVDTVHEASERRAQQS